MSEKASSSQIIKAIRQEMGMSVKELSEELNVTPEYIYSIESKRTPSKFAANRIIQIYLDRGGKKETANRLMRTMIKEYKKKNNHKAKKIFAACKIKL